MKFIYWRGNPQLPNGGYCMVSDKSNNNYRGYGSFDFIAKFKNKDYEKKFPKGIDNLSFEQVLIISKS